MIVAALAGTLLILAAWWRMLWSGWIPLDVNLAAFFYPNWALFRSLTSGGHLPLWDAARNMGEPFWADPQTMAAYPLNWLAALAPDFADFLRLWIILHTLLAAGFAAAWARRAGRGGLPSAATAAAVAGLNGFLMARATLPAHFATASWIYPVLYFEEAGSWRGMAFALAMAWLAGFPPFFIVIAASVFLMAAAKDRRSLRRLLAASAAAAGLSAVQWVPFLELLGHSVRPIVLGASEATRYSLPPVQLMRETLLPLWSALSPRLVGDPAIVGFYVGLPALALSIAGAITGERRERVLACLGAATLVLSLGSHLPGYASTPFLRVFRFPADWLLGAAAAAAFLAARGVQALPERWRGAAAAAVAADLVLFAQFPLAAWGRPAFLADEPILAARLLATGIPPSRIFHTRRLRALWQKSGFLGEDDFLALREFLAPSFGAAFGVPEASSYQVLKTKAAADFLSRMNGPESERFLDSAGVAAVVDAADGASGGPSGARVRWRRAPRMRVFLAAGRGSVRILAYRPGEVRARVRAEGQAKAVFSEIHYPGWRARLDGREVAQGLFEGAFPEVDVPAGKHDLRFAFSPRSFWLGLAISVVSLSAIVLSILA